MSAEPADPADTLDAEALDAAFEQGMALHEQGRLDEAEALYGTILRHDPDDVATRCTFAMLALQTGRIDLASDLCEQAVSLDPDHAEVQHTHGLVLRQQQRIEPAIAAFARATALRPEYLEAHYHQGLAEQACGRHSEALASFDRAVALSPADAELHFRRGAALSDLQRWHEALAGFDTAISLRTDFAAAFSGRGLVHERLGRNAAAIADYDRSLALGTTDPETHARRGRTLFALGRPADAITAYDNAIALRPQDAITHYNRAVALHGEHRLDAALASYDAAIALNPDFSEAHNNRSVALRDSQRLDEALHSIDHVIRLHPDLAGAHNNRGGILQDLGHGEEALAAFDRALALQPDYAEALCNRGAVLRMLRPEEDALPCFEAAIRLQPQLAAAHEHAGMVLLQRGDFARGWPEYEWRWRAPTLAHAHRSFLQPLWFGLQPIAGTTILLHAEQGLGDTLQFCRYAQDVVARGAQVLLEVQPPLKRLLTGMDGVQVIAQGDTLPHFDWHCPLLSLPLALQTRLETIPAYPSYLHADPAAVTAWRQRLAALPGRPVGLVWAGESRRTNPDVLAANRRRSMALAQFAPLADIPGVSFVSLQKGPPAAEAHSVACLRVFDATDELHDFADTAALVGALDLVITVDTSVAHLAGALGKPVWILNRFDSCWRWLLNRTDSPWYPTARLFRQPAPGDWNSVIAEVRQALQAFANAP